VSRSARALLALGALAGVLIACALLLATLGPQPGASAASTSALRPRAATDTAGPGVTLLAPPGVTIVFTATPSLTPTNTLSPTPTVPSPTPSNTLAPTYTPSVTLTPSSTITPGPSPTLTPFPPEHPPAAHFWLARPIGDEFVNYVDRNYIYASTQSGKRQPHHGVDMQSPSGTPVLAAGPGTVVFAGPDWEEQFGPTLAFYGNMVAIQHDQSYRAQPLFTLYGHLATVGVAEGQQVQTGDVIGTVGGTGVALGPHLHFEVRVGRNDYQSTRNPEMWLAPFAPWSILAGRVLDRAGHYVPGVTVDIRSIELEDPTLEPVVRFVTTYAQESVNGDDEFKENFAVGDLPPGTYSVGVSGRSRSQIITVARTSAAWVVLVANNGQ
jgi:murein DD-endopeptidase MepM/ murein hydrolase activator NlpD